MRASLALLLSCTTIEVTPESCSLDVCEEQCVDLRSDAANCGECGTLCASDEVCLDGQCGCGIGARCPDEFACVQNRCLHYDPAGAPCKIECPPSYRCIYGHCTNVDLCQGDESCNAVDDDCDGETDEDLAISCYSGLAETQNIGECRPGVIACIAGSYTECIGEVLPQSELGILACDGLDNDCNGCQDNYYDAEGNCTERPVEKFDVVFFIDWSGSMGENVQAVIDASASVASYYTSEAYMWALVGIPKYGTDSSITVISDFADYMTFLSVLQDEGAGAYGGSCEPNRSAVARAADGTLTLSYRYDATAVSLVFTDEAAQDCTAISYTESSMCAAVQSASQLLYVFTPVDFYANWDECAILYPLVENAVQMGTSINDALSQACGN